jgi:ATP-dependent exoDNAse (exonuclease V) alpha subunit
VLRHELARSLGLLFEEVDNGHADVAGVPMKLRRHFSTRRREITAEMERRGSTSARGAQVAALATREAKGEHVAEAELRDRWARSAAPFDFSVAALPRLVRAPVVEVEDKALALRLTEQDASFKRRDVVRAVAEAATHGTSLVELEARAEALTSSQAVVELADDRCTTPEMLELERRSVLLAQGGVGEGRGVASAEALAAAVGERPSLGADQRAALATIACTGDGLDVLIGPAGTGKTFMLDAAREAWQRSGKRVIGASLAASAARELQLGSGIKSTTVDRLLLMIDQGRERLDGATVLVVDEAGMLGTRRLAALINEASGSGAKLLLVGDPRQLPEIDAGGLFASLATRLGHVALSENRRQRDPVEREVAAELRVGLNSHFHTGRERARLVLGRLLIDR